MLSSSPASQTPILIAGVPRSGTTWVGRILASAPDMDYRFEPDNEEICPYALAQKQGVHRFPYLRTDMNVPQLTELWTAAFEGRVPGRKVEQRVRELGRLPADALDTNVTFRSTAADLSANPPPMPPIGRARLALGAFLAKHVLYGGRRAINRRRIVKSVHSALALDWLRARFSPKIVLVARHPLNVIASYLRMQMKDGDRSIFSQARYAADALENAALAQRARSATDPLARMGYQLAAMTAMMRRYAASDPQCLVVSHDHLCLDASMEFERLFRDLGLVWGPDSARLLDELNQPGIRYQPKRVRADEIDKWKQALTQDQVRTVTACFDDFGLPLEWAPPRHADAAVRT